MERSSRIRFRPLLALSAAVLAVHAAIVSSAADTAARDHGLSYFTVTPDCDGFGFGECLLGSAEGEVVMGDGGSNRRILATTQYVGYGALRRNTVPCSRRGRSYYNCRVGGPANPYSRSCSRITRCRR